MASSEKLPSIRDLFTESWEIFTKSLLHIFIFSIFGVLAYVVLLLIAFILGGSSLLPIIIEKGANFSPTDFTGLNFGVIGLAALILFVGSIIISSIWQAGLMFIIDKPGSDISYKELIKKGFPFVMPLFLTGLISFFLMFGAFFVFIIPGLLLVILFTFTQQEVVLGNKKYFAALKASASIVSSNFGAIFVRMVILWILYVVISAVSGSGSTLTSVLGSILNIFLGWFGLCYMITLYKQVRGSAKELSTWWMWAVSIIGWIIAVILFVVIGASLMVAAKSGELDKIFNQSKMESSSNNMKQESMNSLNLQDDVWTGITAYRTASKLPPIELNSRLCAYAQRRLDQIIKYGKYDDAKGFYEDTANPQVGEAYFTDFNTINEEAYLTNSQTTAEVVVSAWSKREKGFGILPNAEYTNGCVRGSDGVLVLIGASSR